MKQGTNKILEDRPIFHLTNSMVDVRTKPPFNMEGLRVVTTFFDAYQSCAVARDHFLSRIINNTILFYFLSVHEEKGVQTNEFVCTSTSSRSSSMLITCNIHGCVENQWITLTGSCLQPEQTKSLPISITSSFALILIATFLFRIASMKKPKYSLHVFDGLSNFVVNTHWSSRPIIDGKIASEIELQHG